MRIRSGCAANALLKNGRKSSVPMRMPRPGVSTIPRPGIQRLIRDVAHDEFHIPPAAVSPRGKGLFVGVLRKCHNRGFFLFFRSGPCEGWGGFVWFCIQKIEGPGRGLNHQLCGIPQQAADDGEDDSGGEVARPLVKAGHDPSELFILLNKRSITSRAA